MVLLTTTASAAEALERFPQEANDDADGGSSERQPTASDEPSSVRPEVGRPISHAQLLDLWQRSREAPGSSVSLESLLRGAEVFVPPPPPKPKQSEEYIALMARLRRQEEARAYERMLNPPQPIETFDQRFPHGARSFAEANRPVKETDMGDDDVTLNDIHRQVMLLLNFMLSIAGVAGTLWVVARWWPTPARLFLTMGGSILVGIAEVVVYQAYVWKMGEAKKGQGAVKQVQEVVQTWVVGQKGDDEDGPEQTEMINEKKHGADSQVRKRVVQAKDDT